MYFTVNIITSWLRRDSQGIIINNFGVTVESKFKLYTPIHNTARSMNDVNRDGYRDQIVSISVWTLLQCIYVMWVCFLYTQYI